MFSPSCTYGIAVERPGTLCMIAKKRVSKLVVVVRDGD
jgi:hypothetical protein